MYEARIANTNYPSAIILVKTTSILAAVGLGFMGLTGDGSSLRNLQTRGCSSEAW